MKSNQLFIIDKSYALLAIVYCLVSILFEKLFFSENLWVNIYFLLFKIVFIFSFWQIIGYIINKYKNDISFRHFIHYSLVYFLISIVILLLIWPGNWFLDEYHVLIKLKFLQFQAWQHFSTSIFYLAALSLSPSIISIIVLQAFCISLVVGYCVCFVKQWLDGSNWALAMYLPFLIPSVLHQNTLLYRATLLGYLILFFTVCLLSFYVQKKPLTNRMVLALVSVAALISTIRGEGLYFLILAPLLFVCVFWKLSSVKQKVFFTLLSSVFSLCILGGQAAAWHSKLDRFANELSLYVGPLRDLVVYAKQDGATDIVNAVDEILDTSLFDTQDGMDAYWSHELIRDANAFDNGGAVELKRLYLELVGLYPGRVFHNRWNNFRAPQLSLTSYNGAFQALSEEQKRMVLGAPETRYCSLKLRSDVLKILSLYEWPQLKNLVYNPIIPIGMLVIMVFLFLVLKRYAIAFCIGAVLPSAFLVFLTAPEAFFMYYFPSYLAGYVFFTITVLLIMHKN